MAKGKDKKKPPKNTDRELRRKISEIRDAVKRGELTKEQAERMIAELYQSKLGPKADLGQFKELLGSLEASKMKQQRQKSVEGRRDIFAGGLASMMTNF